MTRSIERIGYGNVAGWLGGCLSLPVSKRLNYLKTLSTFW